MAHEKPGTDELGAVMNKALVLIKLNPSAILGVLQAGLVLGVVFGLPLTTEQTGILLACVAAGIALINGLFVRPFQRALAIQFVQAVLAVLIAVFHVHITQDQAGAILAVAAALLGALTHATVSPETRYAAIRPRH